jgi:mannose-6-phosphate isomerase-like protein (cupin superfamily)
MLGGSAGLAAALAGFGHAHGMESLAPASRGQKGQAIVERDDVGAAESVVHGGAGRIRVKHFDFGRAAHPALLLTYVIPPGASEGVHTHRLGDRALGSYDEFYYVLEGSGVMQLGGETVPVKAGDHVFTPLGMPHGIANTAASGDLKILLTAVERG